ncbi:MAG: paraslipin, partial [Erysipelotrichales bacterium]|nr:paraslipin [Erysipelotrichales bacterium]
MQEFLKYLPWIILGIILLAIIISCLVVVPQAHAYIVERLGVYNATWEAGLKLKLPIIERIVRRISLKEQVSDFEPQPVITKDNVTMQIDSVVYWQVFDAKMFTYGVERPIAAIENLCATTLRNIIGELTLDETLTSRDIINSRITKILDEA